MIRKGRRLLAKQKLDFFCIVNKRTDYIAETVSMFNVFVSFFRLDCVHAVLCLLVYRKVSLK